MEQPDEDKILCAQLVLLDEEVLAEFRVRCEEAAETHEQATDLILLVTQASLLAAGFHTHHRQWRRRRYANLD